MRNEDAIVLYHTAIAFIAKLDMIRVEDLLALADRLEREKQRNQEPRDKKALEHLVQAVNAYIYDEEC